MKKFNNLLFLLFVFAFIHLNAQDTRYIDPIFSSVSVESNVTYATNISILTGAPAATNLLMDVYTPDGDDVTSRPVFVVIHTGSFLPQYFNGQVTGSRLDSAVVNTCKRLASRGYVAVAATYRQGWLPLAEDQNVRTSTLLHAAYRGIQDIYSCVRYLRYTVAENDNPYGIDPDKIGAFGLGTGGYISFGVGYLDRYEETVVDKFIDTETLTPYINPAVDGDPLGLDTAILNMVNYPDYDSKVSFVVNLGGAMGDISWLEGNDDEPAAVGFHVVSDPFAPYANGPVIVPTTGDFVVNVSGTWTVINENNLSGQNDILAPVNALDNPLNQIVNFYKTQQIQYGGETITLAVDNIYPFIMPGYQGSPWDWWDKPTLDVLIPQINALFGQNFSADQLHNDGLITSPNMGPEQGNAYLDTAFMYMLPRACNAFELGECMTVSVANPIDSKLVDFKAMPIPADQYITLESKETSPMLNVYLFDVNGKVIRSYTKIDQSQLTIQRENLPSGVYFVKVKFKEGWLSDQVMFK
ncbi:MAG: T9SS type A sorting domain-containing protein [Saprospiraceae bacterium]|nr:T9SS type A sorting domain-containing protein [Saprospiraceae bacterium]MCB9322601.1 T9SS type A sorting domain-containing protein [Lewinellaceae bacterium]